MKAKQNKSKSKKFRVIYANGDGDNCGIYVYANSEQEATDKIWDDASLEVSDVIDCYEI